jgi:hypothetical protein
VSASPATVFIENNALGTTPEVTVAATTAIAEEEDLVPGRFTIYRTGSLTTSLLVEYEVAGSAKPGEDYVALSGTALIAAGSNHATVDVTPLDNLFATGDLDVVITLTTAPQFTLGAAKEATITLVDEDTDTGPTVTVIASQASAFEEGLVPGEFTVRRTGSLADPLTVYYTVAGTATPGQDYATLSGSITIAAGEASAVISVTPLINMSVQYTETVTMALVSNLAYYIPILQGTQYVQITGKNATIGLEVAKTPEGNNYAQAHTITKGKDVLVGILEAVADKDAKKGIIQAKSHLGTGAVYRVIKDLNFTNATAPVTQDPNAVNDGKNEHGTMVADIIGSADPKWLGVAPESKLYVAWTDTLDRQIAAADWLWSKYGIGLFNASFTTAAVKVNSNGNSKIAKSLDWFARERDSLFVVIAGNNGIKREGWDGDGTNQIGTPGDAFNVISVGAVDGDLQARAAYSSYWNGLDDGKDYDTRGKPDILALGGGDTDKQFSNGHITEAGTSFAAPLVTGTAALLAGQKDLALGIPGQSNHLAIKAIILNSARKRSINGPENAITAARDNDASKNQPSDLNYLKADGTLASFPTTMKTAEWTPSQWAITPQGVFETRALLDDEQGTGILDTTRALIQYQGGKQGVGSVTSRGWNVAALKKPSGSGAIKDEYSLNATLAKNTFVTVTLTWDRVVERTKGKPPAAENRIGHMDKFDDAEKPLPNLNLYLYKGETLVAVSKSFGGTATGNNVEHLHIPVPDEGKDYRIVVKLDGETLGANDTIPYALAWWTTDKS